MTLPIKLSYRPMEAEPASELPKGREWQYEPKWDGFRCVAYRDGKRIDLQSKSQKALPRYFPELVDALDALKAKSFVLDGEIVIPSDGTLSFDDLLMRIHPAASRIETLSRETPCVFIVFDLLVDDKGNTLIQVPLVERRERLETFIETYGTVQGSLALSPVTCDLNKAIKWFHMRIGLDGIVAKRTHLPYQSGERSGMQNIKKQRTADFVVGGFRYLEKKSLIGSLLLGLYNVNGLLDHDGFTSSIRDADRPALTKQVEVLIEPPGFSGRAPDGLSRWSTKRSPEWKPLKNKLVVEVQFDHFTGGRFRHGTRFLRWRPEKPPKDCTMGQVRRESRSALELVTVFKVGIRDRLNRTRCHAGQSHA
jgi:ATP-dependent DNA ligase